MAVGDVNSQERGAGARYNDGKVPLELIPAWILGKVESHEERPKFQGPEHEARFYVARLGQWQEGTVTALDLVRQLPRFMIYDAARVFGYGAKKYAAWNWIKGMAWSVPLGCALRHAFAVIDGELLDPESGFTHFGHLACNLIMLAQFERTYPEGDDRPIKWLSTDAPAAPTGGPASLVDPALVPAATREQLLSGGLKSISPLVGLAQSDRSHLGPRGGVVISPPAQ